MPPPPDARPPGPRPPEPLHAAAASGRRAPAPAAGSPAAEAGELLGGYLRGHAAQTLRALRRHREADGSAADAVRELRHSVRRLSATLHTFRGCLDRGWADRTRGELVWLAATLSREYAYAARQERLSAALQRLTEAGVPRQSGHPDGGRNALSTGAARAGALLERRLTLARTRAHSAALRAVGSARFHAVADTIAVLAYEVPVETGTAGRPAHRVLVPPAEQARRRLVAAVDALPHHGVREDAAWHHVRLLLRLHRYAQEVVDRPAGARNAAAARVLDRHRDAVEAAAAAASAAATQRIASSTAYALGVLYADQRHEAEAAGLAFGAQWDAR